MTQIKAIALMSGGLDSTLAARIVKDEGIPVQGINFVSVFQTGEQDEQDLTEIEKQTGIDIELIEFSDRYLEVVKYPDHGYGSSMNPCLDCRIFMLSRARELLADYGADFVVTGEVLGQRPMSQRRQAMDLVQKESGLEGRLLRPLSAKLLPQALPEKKQWVKRENLYGFQGRSRKKQLNLADEFGIEAYSQPAGGCCMLVEGEYEERLREAFSYKGRKNMEKEDFQLLKYGRHFRLPDDSKAIIGRNKSENEAIDQLVEDKLRMEVKDYPSPLTVVENDPSQQEIELAGRLTARYSQGRDEDCVTIQLNQDGDTDQFQVEPLEQDASIITKTRIEQ